MAGMPVLHMRWEELCFLHWRVAPAVIARHLPAGLSVDTYRGAAWLGVVPFRMRAVHPPGLPMPGGGDFLELNCRSYVRDHRGRPGVWFFSLDCDHALAVRAARMGFGLNYRRAALRVGHAPGSSQVVAYRCRRAEGESRFAWRRRGTWSAAADDPLAAFLVERYRLFAWHRGLRRLLTARVEHAPYRVAAASVRSSCAALLRSNRLPVLQRRADHVVLAAPVTVRATAPVPV